MLSQEHGSGPTSGVNVRASGDPSGGGVNRTTYDNSSSKFLFRSRINLYNLDMSGSAAGNYNMDELASPGTIKRADADINIKPGFMAMSPKMGGVSGTKRRSFYDRTFTKLDKGSVRGSIFNLVSAALGGGVLSLSYVFVLSGWATGLIMIGVGTVTSIWSNLLIVQMAIKHNLPNLD